MAKIQHDDKSSRLKLLIDKKYPAWGRFAALESASGISLSRWKNFYYGKQNASEDIIDFWCRKHPDDANWLIEAKEDVENIWFPFSAKIPDRMYSATISDRLIWVISEFASGDGKRLFSYLEEISKGTVPASEWSDLILRNKEPSAEMLRVICSARPMFTEWVIRGSVSYLQVDPTDKNSVVRWNKLENEMFDGLLDEIKRRKQDKPT